MNATLSLFALTFGLGATCAAGELTGHKLLLTSTRIGDTEVFVVDPETGDAQNLSRSAKSEDRSPCWSPDWKRICFMSDRERMLKIYGEKPADKRPVWLVRPEGSRASWKRMLK